jgi:hypothetical protein
MTLDLFDVYLTLASWSDQPLKNIRTCLCGGTFKTYVHVADGRPRGVSVQIW